MHPLPGDQEPPTSDQQPAPAFVERIVALIEVLVCSDYPTQLAIGATFSAFGYGPYSAPGHLRLWYVVGLSIADTVALIALVLLFLAAHGERARAVFIGTQSALQEAAVGVPMILVALGIGLTVIVVIQRLAPSLHTVPDNPFQTLLRTRSDAWLLALVVVLAGGVREEIQRAFLLHRFEVWLGGGGFGRFTSLPRVERTTAVPAPPPAAVPIAAPFLPPTSAPMSAPPAAPPPISSASFFFVPGAVRPTADVRML